MRDDDCTSIAKMIIDAYDETATAAAEFLEQHRSPWSRNARVGYRQSILAARLREHPRLGVDEHRSIEGGRIKVTGLDELPMLLKPLSSLEWPSGNSESVSQPHFEGIEPPEGQPLLAYRLSERTVTLFVGACREVDKKGWPIFEVIGELTEVWSGDGLSPFDQGDDSGWADDLFGEVTEEEDEGL